MNKSELYIGLMSGTSADGIDAALVDFSEKQPIVLTTYYSPYIPVLRKKIFALCEKGDDEIERLGELDILLAKEFAQAANQLLKQYAITADAIKAIGSHGQTIRHYPNRPYHYTLQIGDPNVIAAETGITTIADFRRKDVAYGGQGAPLVPAFHQYAFSSETRDRAIVNIGGIANITLLPRQHPGPVIGFDTGPGNTLMDAWVQRHHQQAQDVNGAWAAEGKVHAALLAHLLKDVYFQLPAPKSTGREYFNLAWLEKKVEALGETIEATDIQATLAELTATSILLAIQPHLSEGDILICGGGIHNTYLMSRLQYLAPSAFNIASTQLSGIDPDWVEATAFAWLAKRTLNREHGNLPSVTGATQATVLGGIYFAT